MQETASREAGTIITSNFYRIVPELCEIHKHGDFDLRVSRKLLIAIVQDPPTKLAPHHLSLVDYGHRHLIAGTRAPFCQLNILVVHGPCVWGSNRQQIDEALRFWQRVGEALRARPAPKRPLVLLGD